MEAGGEGAQPRAAAARDGGEGGGAGSADAPATEDVSANKATAEAAIAAGVWLRQRYGVKGTAALYGDQDDVEEGVCKAPDPEDGAAGATIGSILHCAAWQSRLYGAMALPEGVEHVCEGPLCGTFITRVVEEGEEEAGVIVEWERRRQRKRRLMKHEAALLAERGETPPLDLWAWFRFWEYLGPLFGGTQSAQTCVAYWIGYTFFWGSILFIVGAAGSVSSYVLADATRTQLASNLPYLVGSLFFDVGCLGLLIEAENEDQHHEAHQWHHRRFELCQKLVLTRAATAARERLRDESVKVDAQEQVSDDSSADDSTARLLKEHDASPPHYRWVPRPWPNVLLTRPAMLGAVIFMLGALGFTAGVIGSICETAGVVLTETQSEWWINFSYTFGGAGFVAGGFVYAAEASHSVIKGIVPLSCKSFSSISWWINILNFYGGVGFLIAGGLFYADLSFRAYQIQTVFNYLFASVLYLVASYLTVIEATNPGRQF